MLAEVGRNQVVKQGLASLMSGLGTRGESHHLHDQEEGDTDADQQWPYLEMVRDPGYNILSTIVSYKPAAHDKSIIKSQAAI